MKRKITLAVLALCVVSGLVIAGCSNDNSSTPPSTNSVPAAPPVNTNMPSTNK